MSDDSKSESQQPLNVGDPAPDFHLMASDNAECDLSDLKGEVVVLVFFSETFSEYTMEQVKMFAKLHRSLKSDHVNVIGVVTEPMTTIDTLVDEERVPFRILCDFDRVVVQEFGVLAQHIDGLTMVPQPSVFVINKRGIIIYRWVGQDHEIQPDIEEIAQVARAAL
jgi:peroxiredoxin Q/BCP